MHEVVRSTLTLLQFCFKLNVSHVKWMNSWWTWFLSLCVSMFIFRFYISHVVFHFHVLLSFFENPFDRNGESFCEFPFLTQGRESPIPELICVEKWFEFVVCMHICTSQITLICHCIQISQIHTARVPSTTCLMRPIFCTIIRTLFKSYDSLFTNFSSMKKRLHHSFIGIKHFSSKCSFPFCSMCCAAKNDRIIWNLIEKYE